MLSANFCGNLSLANSTHDLQNNAGYAAPSTYAGDGLPVLDVPFDLWLEPASESFLPKISAAFASHSCSSFEIVLIGIAIVFSLGTLIASLLFAFWPSWLEPPSVIVQAGCAVLKAILSPPSLSIIAVVYDTIRLACNFAFFCFLTNQG